RCGGPLLYFYLDALSLHAGLRKDRSPCRSAGSAEPDQWRNHGRSNARFGLPIIRRFTSHSSSPWTYHRGTRSAVSARSLPKLSAIGPAHEKLGTCDVV